MNAMSRRLKQQSAAGHNCNSRTAIHGFRALLRCWLRVSITTRRAALHQARGARQPQSDSAFAGASLGLLSLPIA